ncbi:type VII secretion integral membrane protein EccD [Saccharopolyspora erythraea NRRL 2338]|uniref:Integral membrane protein n=2 Tax=Saccharopolyspora erythraea TaxID=1836 RepID=A4FPI2_SACEN|nr:type VII secretion integral membrane protein EccD [Saccharopolyspora erythraea]EQD84181.1 membrane protein [Saccharopolyspora erythraea D]PFG99602.1 type VII secretion integral membrane protein EccD [Saccharopolyspora erythraea NRRL 2338]QRK89492.1 type VII secretion integral membrane protein EccD [Saccharopolyspora erythraea]CAM05957.1 integral membrane protein [Saccharopolyspora erythraea NRRL 2338]
MATGTTVFSRVTVVAPTTRIDLALPADVSVADLLPMLLEMAREATPDGGSRHGGWCLAKLSGDELDPSQTLASLGIVDGDMLQLRRRSDNPPPPLYDDVVDALAEAEPGSYRPWTKETAQKLGHISGVLGLVAAAAAIGVAGPAGMLHPELDSTLAMVYQIVAAVVGVAVAILATGVGSMVTRAYGASTTGTVIAAAGGLPMAFVGGFNIVPGSSLAPRLLLASALVLIFAAISIMVIGAGIVTFIAAATVSAFGTIAFVIATLVPRAETHAAGIAAGAAAVGLAGISLLPRITIQLAKLPLPHVPGSAEDLKEDQGFPDYRQIERQTGLAHRYMTGLIIGCGLTAAIGAILSAAGPAVWGPLMSAVVSAVLLLRGRNYANGSQAIALLLCGLLAALGVGIGLIVQVALSPLWVAWVFPPLLLLGVLALVFGVVFPNRRFSPVQRRMVDILEAVLIALVLPLAFGVMDLYMAVRDLNLNFF